MLLEIIKTFLFFCLLSVVIATSGLAVGFACCLGGPVAGFLALLLVTATSLVILRRILDL